MGLGHVPQTVGPGKDQHSSWLGAQLCITDGEIASQSPEISEPPFLICEMEISETCPVGCWGGCRVSLRGGMGESFTSPEVPHRLAVTQNVLVL